MPPASRLLDFSNSAGVVLLPRSRTQLSVTRPLATGAQPHDLVDALLAQLGELRALGRRRAAQVVAESRLDKPHALEEAVKSEPKQITPHPTLDLGRTVVDDLPKEK